MGGPRRGVGGVGFINAPALYSHYRKYILTTHHVKPLVVVWGVMPDSFLWIEQFPVRPLEVVVCLYLVLTLFLGFCLVSLLTPGKGVHYPVHCPLNALFQSSEPQQ